MYKNAHTLWTFGDSFTYGHLCNEDSKDKVYLKYKKENDDIWTNHLGKLLNYKVCNFGKSGASNDFIFDTLIDNFDKIKEKDVVIIGKTIYGRNNFPKNNLWIDISSDFEIKLFKNYWYPFLEKNFTEEETKAIIDYQYYFSYNLLYKERYDKRFDFIKNRLISEKNINYCHIWHINDENTKNFEKISEATNNIIDDYHFSFKGHYEFAKFLKTEIDKQNIKYLL